MLPPAVPYWGEWGEYDQCVGSCTGLNWFGIHFRYRKRSLPFFLNFEPNSFSPWEAKRLSCVALTLCTYLTCERKRFNRDCLYERLDDSCVSQMVNASLMDPLGNPMSRVTNWQRQNCQPDFECTTTTTTTTTTTLGICTWPEYIYKQFSANV